jgi:ankyrin repeat protein
MAALHSQDKNQAKWVLDDNCYVMNAYGSFEPYEDRTITPLHHILCQAADGLVDHEYAQYCTEMLLEHRANPNARDDAGNTPMHHASTPELVQLLLQCGAKYNKYGQEGRTPLQNNIRTRNWPVVRCLLNVSVGLNVCDDADNNPLHEAVKQNAPADILHLLLINEVHYDAKNRKHKTPVDMAKKKPEILRVFEAYLQAKLCNMIAKHCGDSVIVFLDNHAWINLTIDGTCILDWAKKFYPYNDGTWLLERFLSKF